MILNFFQTLLNEITGFLSYQPLWEMIQKGDYSQLLTYQGILNMLYPLMPLLLIIEIVRALVHKRFKLADYQMPFFIFVANRIIGRFISIGALSYCIAVFTPFAILKASFTWYWVIYGYLIWEFSHFIYHYLAHKIRLFWCLHSTHHAPEEMNLAVSHAHFFLEAPYADVIRTSICILAGVEPALLFFIMFIDGTWGTFIHAGENLLKDGRMGILNKYLLTPSHHRVHHARNPLYMDTNFCNLLNIWDKVFGTYQDEEKTVPVEYGITRKIKAHNFWDVYFGEFALLISDVYKAPGIVNKIKYIFMPPGWNHAGNHSTAKIIRDQALENFSNKH